MNGEGYQQRVLQAVKDPDWQQFRASLKGLDTRDKLIHLYAYWLLSDKSDEAKLRVDNYIKALCRGGQLYPGESFDTFWNSYGELDIRKGR